MGADLFFLPRYMNCGSLALPGLKMGSSTMPLLSLVILLNTGLAVVVVVAGVVAAVVVDVCSLLCPRSRNINIVLHQLLIFHNHKILALSVENSLVG